MVQPKRTAMNGLTYAYVATRAGVLACNSQTYAVYPTIDPAKVRYSQAPADRNVTRSIENCAASPRTAAKPSIKVPPAIICIATPSNGEAGLRACRLKIEPDAQPTEATIKAAMPQA